MQRKAKGHAVEAPERSVRPSNVINLMDALRSRPDTRRKQLAAHQSAGDAAVVADQALTSNRKSRWREYTEELALAASSSE